MATIASSWTDFDREGLFVRRNAASDVGAPPPGSAVIKSVTGPKSDENAESYARHADKITLNRKVVERWDEALAATSGVSHESELR